MQWPAPSGFHVPSQDEWVELCWILTTTFGMASNATTLGAYLKMPKAGLRSGDDWIVRYVNDYWYYWASWARTSSVWYGLYFYSTAIDVQWGGGYMANGDSIRCFKDSPVSPDSSWTTLYDWSSVATWAWIFHNATLWLISVSWDGTNWITIQDKNLWAATVYNSWDTLSESNCGWYFQWGNNYMFPFTWTITTSSTRVDTTWYWPWNYYSSSTFIKYDWRWSSIDNRNLWWWVTWILQASWNLVVWDKLYKIVTSTTAPASWTTSNIITIVTD